MSEVTHDRWSSDWLKEHPWDLEDTADQVQQGLSDGRTYLVLIRLNRLLERLPEGAELWYYRALLCGRLGLRLEEVRSWRRYLKLRPDNRLMARLLSDRIDVFEGRTG